MVAELSDLLAAIEAILLEPAGGGPAAVADGYARALELEAERWRLERKISEVARRLAFGDTARRADELSSLSERLASADGDLQRLRVRLAELRRHADAVRAA